MVSLRVRSNIFCLSFFSLDQIRKIKICYMVVSENPDLIEERRRLIAKIVLDPEDAAEDGVVDDDGAASDEEDDSSLGQTGVNTGVTESGKEEAEEMQWAVKYASLSSYMLKPHYFLTQVF